MQLYGGSFNLIRNGLPRIGIDVTLVDIFDTQQIQRELKPQTKLVWFEVCTNPHIMLVDVEKVVSLVKSYNSNIVIGVDNTFLSPWTLVSLEKKRFLSEVGFEPTPSFEDQNAHLFSVRVYLLSLAP